MKNKKEVGKKLSQAVGMLTVVGRTRGNSKEAQTRREAGIILAKDSIRQVEILLGINADSIK